MANRLKELIFKPKWQHKEARIRAWAVSRSEDPRLIDLLPELARTDPAPEVRLSALRRLSDIDLMHDLAYGDADEQVREHCLRVFRQLMTGEHPDAPDAEKRAGFMDRLDDAALVEHLAMKSTDDTLRGRAQGAITKQGLLGDIAISDPSHELRILAAERLEQRSTLERVAKAARKTNKQVFKIVSAKIEALDIASGDTSALAARALGLCEQVEALARSDDALNERLATLEALRAQWEPVAEAAGHELTARFLSGARILELAAGGMKEDPVAKRQAHAAGVVAAYLQAAGPLAESEATEDIGRVQAQIQHGEDLRQQHVEDLEPEIREQFDGLIKALSATRERLLEAQPGDPALARLSREVERRRPEKTSAKVVERLKTDFDRAWSGLTHPNASDQSNRNRFRSAWDKLSAGVESREAARSEALASLETRVASLEKELEGGDLTAAANAKQSVLDALQLIGRHPQVDDPEFKARIAAARGQLHELRDWQHWANNEVRARLCEKAEAIPGSGMHPDAVTARLKELQGRWKAMDASERLPGDAANRRPNPALWRRFHAACNEAFEAAKPYFEKRAEVRGQNLDKINAVVEALKEAQGKKDADLRETERLIAQARRTLRELDGVPPKDRKRLGRALREGAQVLDDRLEDHYQVVERRKQKIIDEVQALVELEDLDQAIGAAKEAQKRWQEAGHTRRKREQKMWKAFRAASDAVFGRLDDQRAERNADRQQALEELNGLIEAVRAVLADESLLLAGPEGEMRRIREAWSRVDWKDRRLEQTYQGLCEDVTEAARKLKSQMALKQREQVREMAHVVRAGQVIRLGGEGDLDTVLRRWAEGDAESARPELVARFEEVREQDDQDAWVARADANLTAAGDLCIRMEFLAGVDSPADCQEQRMAYQVQRLSERMGGAESVSPRDEAAELERLWVDLGPLPLAEVETLDQRFWKALAAFEAT